MRMFASGGWMDEGMIDGKEDVSVSFKISLISWHLGVSLTTRRGSM